VWKTLEEADEAVRSRYTPHYHLGGTAAMTPREFSSEVESKSRVYGVDALRIVDASIFPLIPKGNNQSDLYAVAQKAADVLMEAWKIRTRNL
jgi:choline dehydrogenase-like flavoprotein